MAVIDEMACVGKIGETGKVITLILKSADSNGVMQPHDLTGYTGVVMQVETSGGMVIMNQVACVVGGTPTNGQITCTTDLTVATHSGLVKGTHRLEFSGLNAAGKKRYWPLNKDGKRTYGVFIVQDPLA